MLPVIRVALLHEIKKERQNTKSKIFLDLRILKASICFMGNYLLLFLLGAVFGSFFYTLALRFIDGSMKQSPRNALLSRSKCPSCGKVINPFFLIPIVGFIILRGKCAKCKTTISPFYLAAEIVSGALFVFIVHALDMSPLTVAAFLLAEISLCIAIIDAKSMIIPDSLVIAFFCISLFSVILRQEYSQHLYGLIAAFIFFALIMLIFPGSFGGGDVKFASAIGFYCGISLFIVAIETALITGTIIGLLYLLAKKKSLKSKIPFAPFLSAGLITAMISGQKIILLYKEFMR